MIKHLGLIWFAVALLAGCTTWETYDAGYDTSKGLATFHQSGLKPEAVYIAQVDEAEKGWGMPTEIKLTPGEHVIGFAAHPSFYYLVPTDPNEEYNARKDSVYHWVKFTAKANQDYEAHYEIKDGSLHLAIVEISSGNISSETIGNYVNLPDEYKVR